MSGAVSESSPGGKGRRDTEQRRAIREVVLETERPLSVDEILELARERVPAIGVATVYRTLKLLVEEGAVSSVPLLGQADRYEARGKGHHHHFHCDSCGRLFDVSACAHEVHRLAPRGFQVERHEVLLYGRCSECSQL